MNINEIRNNLFGLSDLKSLINENVFDEAGGRAGGDNEGSWDWAGFFADNPKRLEFDNFAQAMGFKKAPKEPVTVEEYLEMGGGESEIVKYFGSTRPNFQTELEAILANPINFVPGCGKQNTFKIRRNAARKKFGFVSQKTKKRDQIIDVLKGLFDRNGGGAVTARENVLDYEYFEEVRKVSEAAIAEAFNNGYKLFSNRYIDPNTGKEEIVEVGNINDAFSLFLFFYYVVYSHRGHGTDSRDVEKAVKFENEIIAKYPKYANILASEIALLRGGRDEDKAVIKRGQNVEFIEKYFLKPFKLSFFSEENIPDAINLLYHNNLYDLLLSMRGENYIITEAELKNYLGTVGGAAMTIWFLFNMKKNIVLDDFRKLFLKYFGSDEYSDLRGVINRARYIAKFNINKPRTAVNDIIGAILKSYGDFNIDNLFDPGLITTKSNTRNAFMEAERNGFEAKYFSLELPLYNDEDIFNPFEAFILFADHSGELLKDNMVKQYGGPNIVNKENLFNLSAGQGLELLKGSNIRKEKYQRLETMYEAEKKTEPWVLYDLLNKDAFGTDKTQRAIYNFLRINTNPEGVKWTYEYNRKTQHDKELNPKSIDMLCEYNGGVAGFEYQGEYHFRPQGVTPADEIEDSVEAPMVGFYNALKKQFIQRYINAHDRQTGGSKWEVKEIYEPILISIYEDGFKRLFFGEGFDSAYRKEMQMPGYMNNRARNILAESKKERQRDTFDVAKYMFCILCRFKGLPFPERFRKFSLTEDVYKNESRLNTDIVFLASPARLVDELHVHFTKISDTDKAELMKRRGWAAIYILPAVGKVSENDYEEVRRMANPSNAVFEWSDRDKENILKFAKSIGIPVEENEEEVPEEASELFETIIKEILQGYNLL